MPPGPMVPRGSGPIPGTPFPMKSPSFPRRPPVPFHWKFPGNRRSGWRICSGLRPRRKPAEIFPGMRFLRWRIEGPARRGESLPLAPRYRRPLFLAAAISILLLSGGAFYFVDGISGRKSSDHVIPVRARSASDIPVFDVGNLKGYLNKQASGEPLYVVKGTVTNVGKAAEQRDPHRGHPAGQG